MTLSFSHKQAWDFKTALANYISTATNGNLKEHQKTKIMIIAKRQLAMASSFTFNGNVIETCKSYPYLGSLISIDMQFKLNIRDKFSKGYVTILLDLHI